MQKRNNDCIKKRLITQKDINHIGLFFWIIENNHNSKKKVKK